MSDTERYLAHAQRCIEKAQEAVSREHTELWLQIAQTWLVMIQGTPSDGFEAAVHHLAPGEHVRHPSTRPVCHRPAGLARLPARVHTWPRRSRGGAFSLVHLIRWPHAHAQ